jgi:signal transduction protein with GAF and PtsI domain
MNTYHDSLLKLVGLSNFLEQQTGLDECLNDLAEMAAGILEVRNCSIMLFHHEKDPGEFRLRVFAQCGPLPEIARHEAANINGGIAGQVASKGEPLLVEDITQTAFFPLARRPDEPSKSFISVPIGIAGTVIGIINFSNPITDRCLDAGDLNSAVFVAMLVGKSIQVVEMQKILQSRFLQFAMAQETKALVGSSIAPLSQDPEKLAKIVAKTFYREMTKVGFDSRHILKAATEIISLLNQTLMKHKKRMEGSEPAGAE